MGVNPVGTNLQAQQGALQQAQQGVINQATQQANQQNKPWMSRHPYLTAGMMGAGPITMGMGALNGGDFGSMLFGKKAQNQQIPLYNQQGMDTLNWLQTQGKQNADFGPIEDLYRKRFEEETMPGIAERFTAMGGGRRSSAFQHAMGRSRSDFDAQMAALRSQHGMRQLEMGLKPQFENVRHERIPGFFENIGGAAMSMLPLLAGI